MGQLCGKRRSIKNSLKKRNILHTIKRMKGNWIGHIFSRNCHLKHVIEEKWKGREYEGKDINSYWISLRRREYAGN